MMFFRKILFLLHFIVLFLLFGTFLNAYIPPSVFPYFNLLSLAFPALFIVHLFFSFVWILMWKKRAILFLAATLFFVNPVRRWINFTENKKEAPNFKIITLNARGGVLGYENIKKFIENENADIVLGQEVGYAWKVDGFPYRTEKSENLVGIYSKYKILNIGKINAVDVGEAMYADILVRNQKIRFVTIYLNPYSFEKEKLKKSEEEELARKKASYILQRLIPTYKTHQKEIANIKKIIENSPYPVIIAGDFNAVPNSYEYYKLSDGLEDAFVKAGNGSGTSFHDYKIPIRIDYIFASKLFKPISYKVDRTVHLSDHFPVIAEFKIPE